VNTRQTSGKRYGLRQTLPRDPNTGKIIGCTCGQTLNERAWHGVRCALNAKVTTLAAATLKAGPL
jgi:hypothetical protein